MENKGKLKQQPTDTQVIYVYAEDSAFVAYAEEYLNHKGKSYEKAILADDPDTIIFVVFKTSENEIQNIYGFFTSIPDPNYPL